MSKLGIFKGLAEFAVSAGTGAVVGNIVRATTPEDLTRLQKITLGIGAYALGGVLGDLSAKYITSQIDDYVGKFNQFLHPVGEETSEPLAEWERELLESGNDDVKSTDPTKDAK